MNELIGNFFKDWMILNEKIFSEKFTYNTYEFYSYYQLSGVVNPNLMGGTVSFKPLALMIKEMGSNDEFEYYLVLIDKSIDLEEVVKQFVFECIL